MPGTYQYDVEIKSNVAKLLSDMKQVQDRLDTVEGKEYKIKLNVDEKKLSSVISNLEKMLDSLGKGTGDFKQFENLSKELSSVVSEVQSLSKAFGKVDDSGTKTLLSSIQSIDKSLSKLSQNILNVNKNMSNIGGNTSGTVKQVENISNAYQNAAKKAEKLADAQSKIGQKTNNSSASNQKKDAFQGADTKIDKAATLAKDLNKTLNQVDIPTDSFDKVLQKLDRTKSELVDVIKITRKSVSDKDGKFHDSYTLKDSRGSTEIYGVNSKTNKGQILEQNIVKYDAKKDSVNKSKEELEIQKKITKEIEEQEKANQKKFQKFQKENDDFEKEQKETEAIKRQKDAYENLMTTIKEYGDVAKRVSSGKADDGDLERMTPLESKISELQKQPILSESQIAKSESALVKLYDQLDKIERKTQKSNQKKVNSGFDNLSTYSDKVGKYKTTIDRLKDGGWASDAYEKNVNAVEKAVGKYETLLNELKNKDASLITNEDIQTLKEYEDKIKKTISAVQNMSAAEKGYNAVSGQKELDKIHKLLNENSKMSSRAKAQIKAFYKEIESGNPSMSLDKIHTEIMKIVNAEVEAGRGGKSFFNTLKNSGFHQIAAQMAGMVGVYDVINVIKQAASTVTELNTQITELAKVSEQSSKQIYADFDSYADIAKEVRGTISDTIAATADWSKNGYSIPDAKQLAEVSQLYKNVGDGIDIDTANESLISTLKGFKLEAKEAEHIVDVFNEVSNNEAISSGGIGDALQRSAASFNAANTSLEKSVALVTATNSVLQDPEKVGCTYIADLYSNVMKIKVAISVNIQKWTRPSKDLYVVI
jgi:phage tail tape measure protein, TP901 family|nr:MAG TPA: minor tail protein [Caudoviricetes sp.]